LYFSAENNGYFVFSAISDSPSIVLKIHLANYKKIGLFFLLLRDKRDKTEL